MVQSIFRYLDPRSNSRAWQIDGRTDILIANATLRGQFKNYNLNNTGVSLQSAALLDLHFVVDFRAPTRRPVSRSYKSLSAHGSERTARSRSSVSQLSNTHCVIVHSYSFSRKVFRKEYKVTDKYNFIYDTLESPKFSICRCDYLHTVLVDKLTLQTA